MCIRDRYIRKPDKVMVSLEFTYTLMLTYDGDKNNASHGRINFWDFFFATSCYKVKVLIVRSWVTFVDRCTFSGQNCWLSSKVCPKKGLSHHQIGFEKILRYHNRLAKTFGLKMWMYLFLWTDSTLPPKFCWSWTLCNKT